MKPGDKALLVQGAWGAFTENQVVTVNRVGTKYFYVNHPRTGVELQCAIDTGSCYGAGGSMQVLTASHIQAALRRLQATDVKTKPAPVAIVNAPSQPAVVETPLSEEGFKVSPYTTTHYNKPVTWYSIECLKCGSRSHTYRSPDVVVKGQREHKCPPHRGTLSQAIRVVADGSTWSTRLDLKVGDSVWCPYYYATKEGKVSALTSDYTGPTSAIVELAAYWP